MNARIARCPFCDIVAGEAPATSIYRGKNTVVIVPLNPVTPGHLLVIPRTHVTNFTSTPTVTADVMRDAALFGRAMREECDGVNLITSAGEAATQTVMHLHVHLVPRRHGDGLTLPWTNQP